ncbi:RHS repeat-associated core domain-containing protein [Clostridium sp. BNL1100]|uniref:RHS repeat-associated core domain-containing protein n=1 Tax=Clostridium sp. BNL1100 TaxID=755731 RepID=UPI00024A77E4|nr:RHS repeat-associated core domain-containing protein [Clostridium sp. BNL1100]AEY65641.1 RHS repeat-associated core domain protein [Clostridium sp. BNL1100]
MKLKTIFISIFSFIFILLSGFNFVFAEEVQDKSGEYNGLGYARSILKEGITPPYSISNAYDEDIDTSTGAITLKQTDISLKGRNGLDFSLTRYYTQNNSTLYEPYATSSPVYGNVLAGYCIDTKVTVYTCVNGIVVSSYVASSDTLIANSYSDAQNVSSYYNSISDEYGSEYYSTRHQAYVYDVTSYSAGSPYAYYVQACTGYSYSNNLNNVTSNEKYSYLGAGWAFDLPYIENISGYLYLNYGSAGTWQIDFGSSAGQSHLKNYPLIDMKLNRDNQSYSNGQASSYYVLEQKDGGKTFFGNDGRLLGIKDRYNNEIKFQHDTSATGYPIVNKIIDSVGREINISYTKSQVLVTVNDAINSANNRTVKYNKTAISGYSNDYVLDNVIDPLDRQTTYRYTINSAKVDLLYKSISSGITNQFACLTKVISPTAGETCYAYSKITKNCGTDGVMEAYKLFERFDSKNDGEKLKYRKLNYLYGNTGEYDGYPNYRSDAAIPDTYTYKTQIVDNLNNSEIYTYNKKLLPLNILREGADHKNETINEYDPVTRLLLKTCNKIFNKATNEFMQKNENYQYDSSGYRDLVGYWDCQATRDNNNMPLDNKHKVTFTYGTYHYTLAKEYNQDAATTIKEEYTPTSDNKAVQWKKIYLNGVLKSKTYYDYDVYGNVKEEKRFWDDGVTSVSTKYDYSDNQTDRNGKFNGVYLTRIWADVKDIDPVESNEPGSTVQETYKYDWYGNIVESFDAKNGNPTKYEFDKLNRVIKETHPDASYKSWSYTTRSSENSTIVTDEKGTKIKYNFDKLGNLESEQDFSSGEFLNQYTYDSEMKLKAENNRNSSPSYRSITYNYLSDGKLAEKETTDQSNVVIDKESYTYNDASENGSYTKVTKTVMGDVNSPSIISVTYTDKTGRLVKQGNVHNGAEYLDTFKYDYVGNKITEKTARAYDEPEVYLNREYTTKFDYDHAGNVIMTTNIDGTYSRAGYDTLGRLAWTSDFKASLTGDYCTSYEYDSLGRLIKETVPFQNENGTLYSTIKKHYYDENGNLLCDMISNSKPGEALTFSETRYDYDSRNMLTNVTKYENNSPENYTQYYYDPTGNKLRMYTGLSSSLNIKGLDDLSSDDESFSTNKYEYDRFNNLVKMTDPNGNSEIYSYDLNGNQLQKKDKNGSLINMTYDGDGRLLTKSVENTENPSLNASYTYTYTLTGKKKEMNGGGTNTEYFYDDLGRLVKEVSSNEIQKEYTYDAANNCKSIVIKQNGLVKTNTTYTYDNMNRLEKVYENGVLTATYEYDANGNRQSLTYSNGNKTTYMYNADNKLDSITNIKNGTLLSSYIYQYYLDGNQASKTGNKGKTTSYKYDGLGRLTNEIPSDEPAVSYAYDDSNNRKTMTINGKSVTNYTYDKSNRLLAETTEENSELNIARYNYDNNGNTICKTTEKISPTIQGQTTEVSLSTDEEQETADLTLNEYDGFNQLIKTSTGDVTAEYTYDGTGLRTSKNVNGTVTNHIWDGDQIALETDESGNIKNKYVRGINLIYAEDELANKKFYLFNGHGDVTQLTDASGDVIKNYDYDAFGNEKNPDVNDANVFRYSGEYFDKETGTIYLRARYYDPEIGRFISEDSYWGKDNDPLSLNLYTYAMDNPIMFVDPSGHAVTSWDIAHCTRDEIKLLWKYGNMWVEAKEVNNYNDMTYLHNECERIRNRHRLSFEIGTGDGNTKNDILKLVGPAPKQEFIKCEMPFGTVFGNFGTLVKNPGITVAWKNITKHGLERMAERGVTKELVESIVSNGKVLAQDGGKKFFYITKQGVVILGKGGEIITTYTKNDFYPKIVNLVKKLFN